MVIDFIYHEDYDLPDIPAKTENIAIKSNQKVIVTIRGVRIDDISEIGYFSDSKLDKELLRIKELKKKWESNPLKEVNGRIEAYTDEYYEGETSHVDPPSYNSHFHYSSYSNKEETMIRLDKFRIDPAINTYMFDIEYNKPQLLFHFKFIGLYNITILSSIENFQIVGSGAKINMVFWNRHGIISEYSYHDRMFFVELLNLHIDEEHGMNLTYKSNSASSSNLKSRPMVQIKVKSDIQVHIKEKNLKLPMCP
jgi:hypothetical protein